MAFGDMNAEFPSREAAANPCFERLCPDLPYFSRRATPGLIPAFVCTTIYRKLTA